MMLPPILSPVELDSWAFWLSLLLWLLFFIIIHRLKRRHCALVRAMRTKCFPGKHFVKEKNNE